WVTKTSRVTGRVATEPVVTVSRVTSVVVVVTGVSATQPANPNSASKQKGVLISFLLFQFVLAQQFGFVRNFIQWHKTKSHPMIAHALRCCDTNWKPR